VSPFPFSEPERRGEVRARTGRDGEGPGGGVGASDVACRSYGADVGVCAAWQMWSLGCPLCQYIDQNKKRAHCISDMNRHVKIIHEQASTRHLHSASEFIVFRKPITSSCSMRFRVASPMLSMCDSLGCETVRQHMRAHTPRMRVLFHPCKQYVEPANPLTLSFQPRRSLFCRTP
jgi:hypothetical protein